MERHFGDLAENLYEVCCLLISLAGLAIRCVTVGFAPSGTSGRNTGGLKAARLNTTGMYSIVRHPLYLGNAVILAGVLLFVQVWWFALVGALLALLHYERIIFAEEEFLKRRFGESYERWARETHAIIPDFKKWKPPQRPFSFRRVLRKEHTSASIVLLGFGFLDLVADILLRTNPHLTWDGLSSELQRSFSM